MLTSKRRAVVAVRTLFLVTLAASEAHAQFSIRDGFLAVDGERFIVRGAAYSSRPIGFGRYDSAPGGGCRYARDLPLLAAAGANTVRTVEVIAENDVDFRAALDAADLYWLADFSLEEYPEIDSPAAREAVLSDFLAYAAAWRDEPRLIGFVWSAGGWEERRSFFSLAEEAGRRLRESASGKLLTVAVNDTTLIGSAALGADDAGLPSLDFWSLNLTGRLTVSEPILNAVGRTAKPLLVAAFGVDAFDAQRGAETPDEQSRAAEALTREIESLSQSSSPPVLGGLWVSFVDEWWRGGPEPDIHGALGLAGTDAADGELNPAWLGLFRAVRSGVAGLDTVRPRGAYFRVAQSWGGSPPAETTLPGAPVVFAEQAGAMGGDFPFTAPGALTSFPGERLSFTTTQSASTAALPSSLGTVSLCIAGRPAGMLYVDESEIRARAPEDLAEGEAEALPFRGGTAGVPVRLDVRAAAPSIFPGAVLRPGRPCSLLGANAGVRPGDSLEIYGTGLAAGKESPAVLLNGDEIAVSYFGPLAGVAGVYQTNVTVPDAFSPGPAELRVTQGGMLSNRHDLAILYPWDEEDIRLSEVEPGEVLVQAGGAPRRLSLHLSGFNGYCGLVRFELAGLPAGVRASIPVSLPGSSVPLQLWADPNAPPTVDVRVALRALATTASIHERVFRVTVLPALGDIRLRVVSGGWASGEPLALFQMEGQTLYQAVGGGLGRGFSFLSIDPVTGVLGAVRQFDTWGDDDDVRAMEDYIESLPPGAVVLAAIADDGFLRLRDETKTAMRDHLGAELIDQLEYQDSWAIIARKDAGRPIAERRTRFDQAEIELVLSFPME